MFDHGEYHPNISGTRNLKKVGEYVTKDGDYVLYGVEEEEFRELLKDTSGAKEKPYHQVLKSVTYEEACEVVQRIDPRSWINNGERIRENLRYSYQPQFPEYVIFTYIFYAD